jgi:mycothione reductase
MTSGSAPVKEYGMIAIGSGSAVSVLDSWLRTHPGERGAVIDKDSPGGICLTRGCIPSKMLTSVADVIRTVQRAPEFGLSVRDVRVDFARVMKRLHDHIDPEIEAIRQGLSQAREIDYYPETVEFVAPYTLRTARGERLRAPRILLGLGSEPRLPPIPGLAESEPLTSDTVFDLRELPDRLTILGGGYIAAEFAHIFSSFGSEVTVIGRNPRLLPREDPEISEVVTQELGKRVRLLRGRTPRRIRRTRRGSLTIDLGAEDGQPAEDVEADRILVATGRGSTSHHLHPERGGIDTDPQGWIRVNEYLETRQPGIYALGDATGVWPFKHKANYDARILHEALVNGRRIPVDYHAIPHAVFTDPEVASVGWTEEQARAQVPSSELLVGRYEYRHTAKGEALGVHHGLVKVLVRRNGLEILGAHIVGPQASILLQEVVNLLYTPDRSALPILQGLHIHPALSEVVERAFLSLRLLEDPPARSPP